jgi:hypothetical protein
VNDRDSYLRTVYASRASRGTKVALFWGQMTTTMNSSLKLQGDSHMRRFCHLVTEIIFACDDWAEIIAQMEEKYAIDSRKHLRIILSRSGQEHGAPDSDLRAGAFWASGTVSWWNPNIRVLIQSDEQSSPTQPRRSFLIRSCSATKFARGVAQAASTYTGRLYLREKL